MKRRILYVLILIIGIFCFNNLLSQNIAKAEETIAAYNIEITQDPSKRTYTIGEELDLSDMIVTGYFINGTVSPVTDYTVFGYDSHILGVQAVRINYQGCSKYLYVTVYPAKVTGISVIDYSNTSITLTWDASDNVKSYEVYSLDETTGNLSLIATTTTNNITLYAIPGSIFNIQICAVGDTYEGVYISEHSDTFLSAIAPNIVPGLSSTASTVSSISLIWQETPGATGYLIYRSNEFGDSFSRCGITENTSYTDNTAASGTTYLYKVFAYNLDPAFMSSDSLVVAASTYPAKVILRGKPGDQKARLSWNAVPGATSYDIYVGKDYDSASLLVHNLDSLNRSYIVEGLVAGNTYSFYAIAHREFNGSIYDSEISDILQISVTEVEDTNTNARLFADEEAFINSWSYNNVDYFKDNVDYSASFVIPGLVTTNVGGFSSTAMCPQGLTFAGDYILLTAYDLTGEEYSVIYVINKYTKEQLTTLVLPNYSHVGGIGFDGEDIWITLGTNISSFPYSVIDTAVEAGGEYTYIGFDVTFSLGVAASYITYYDEKLWVGSYNELKNTKLRSYMINNGNDIVTLTKVDTITMPTRVQGIAFTEDGYLILSRSCQLYMGLRGYMRQLDIYQPDFSKLSKGVVPLGKIINMVEMPSMNEEIAIDGNYLYVNFESAVFVNSTYKMDRVCAFDLSSLIK
ncbi:MAG TPA: bacterial Ig-like domain-containing protein [Mobilitalea sp.]|nr:bacterial Ig-like domain-containing protein [Mobilitalea sp.]